MPFHAASEVGIAAAGAPEPEVELVEIAALGRAPAAACPAGAAGLVGQYDVIAAPEAFHVLPYPLDDARALMAQDQRPLRCIVPFVDIADIGVADAACGDRRAWGSSSRGPSISRVSIDRGPPLRRRTAARIVRACASLPAAFCIGIAPLPIVAAEDRPGVESGLQSQL